MKRIRRENATITTIDRSLEPAIFVDPGESFIIETEDAAAGYFQDDATLPYPEDRPTHRADPPHLNPVGGPVYIRGVEKGDTVVVRIEDISVGTRGYTILQPGDGLLGDSLKYRSTTDHYTRILAHEPGPGGTLSDGYCIFNDSIRWKLSPHIGTICLAPEREAMASVTIQGPYGGNVDSRDIRTGARLHLQARCEGGLLFAGDVHACEGDGELTGTADETRGTLTLSCEVIKGRRLPHMRIEHDDRIIALYCDKPLESAVRGATLNLLDWLTVEYGFDEREAWLMIGTCPEFRIHVYQMVDIPGLSYTAGAEIPGKYVS